MNTISLKFTISPTEALSKAWYAVTSNMGVMAGFTILFYLASAIVGNIPVVGSLTNLLQFIFSVSLFSAFQAIDRNGKASFSDLFNWTPKFGRLLAAHLITIAMAIILLAPALILALISLGPDFLSSTSAWGVHISRVSDASAGILVGIFAIAFVALLLLAIFIFAFMFLMQFKDLSLVESLKLSLNVGRDNIGGIIVFALLSLGVAILGALALLIGLLVAIPLIVGTQYYLLRSIFPIEEAGKWDFMTNEEAGI